MNNKNNDPKKPAKLSPLDEDILILLKAQGKLYGLQILNCLNLEREERLGRKISFGTLYPALNRLEKKQLVKWEWGDENEVSGGGRRKYYEISNFGQWTLQAVQNYRKSLVLQNNVICPDGSIFFPI